MVMVVVMVHGDGGGHGEWWCSWCMVMVVVMVNGGGHGAW